ncbi:MAG TPA: hypothetical protein VGF24_07145 [Vicinamibacterales bacterium]|jgi:hypothetical protein
MSAIRLPSNVVPTSIDDLRARGDLIPALGGEEHILSGGFATGISKGPVVRPSDQRNDFSVADKPFTVFVTWSPQQRLKGMVALRLHDADNKVLAEGKPVKKDFRKDELVLMSWTVPVPKTPGIYRADVLFNDKPTWRGFVRITP